MRTNPTETIDAPETAEPVAPSISVRLRSLQLDGSERRNTRRFRWWKVFIGLLVLGGLGGAGSYGYVNIYIPSNFPEVDVFVFTGPPTKETLLDLSGYVEPRVKVNVGADVGGTINRVLFVAGQKVKKGDLLIQIDDDRYKAEYDQAVADLGTAEAQLLELQNGSRPEEIDQARSMVEQMQARLDKAKKDFQRAMRLEKGSMSANDFDQYLSAYEEAKANLRNQQNGLKLAELGPRQEKIKAAQYSAERARANVNRAKWFLERARIVAPITGTILEKKTEAGESVHPEVVSPALLVLADMTRLDAEVDVQERDLNVLPKCDRCEIIPDAHSDRVYEGKVDHVQPMVNRQRGVVQIKVAIRTPDDYLRAGMNCRVLFVKDPPKDADKQLPLIPKRALADEEDAKRKVVYVLEDKIARRRVIEVGQTKGDEVEVAKGLQPGDVLLIPGAQPLSDGQPIRPRLPGREDRPLRKDR